MNRILNNEGQECKPGCTKERALMMRRVSEESKEGEYG
jgi:hypothetical protein